MNISKKAKIIIVIVAVIIVAVIAYFIFRKPKAAVQTQPSMAPGTAKPSGTSTTVSTPAETFPLKKGSKGENTKRLQIALNRIAPDSKISEDGIFGPATENKVLLTLPTSYYSAGPSVTEDQLTNIIREGNNAGMQSPDI